MNGLFTPSVDRRNLLTCSCSSLRSVTECVKITYESRGPRRYHLSTKVRPNHVKNQNAVNDFWWCDIAVCGGDFQLLGSLSRVNSSNPKLTQLLANIGVKVVTIRVYNHSVVWEQYFESGHHQNNVLKPFISNISRTTATMVTISYLRQLPTNYKTKTTW